jgi:hypothetical protein
VIDTWTCHVCGDERPDERISVYSTTVQIGAARIEATQNVRYCNDRPACIEGAKHVDFFSDPAHYDLRKE